MIDRTDAIVKASKQAINILLSNKIERFDKLNRTNRKSFMKLFVDAIDNDREWDSWEDEHFSWAGISVNEGLYIKFYSSIQGECWINEAEHTIFEMADFGPENMMMPDFTDVVYLQRIVDTYSC